MSMFFEHIISYGRAPLFMWCMTYFARLPDSPEVDCPSSIGYYKA